MAVDARIIANEVLRRAWKMGFEPTQIDIQKIAYFLHGHHLKDHGRPMIRSEFEAMEYGPVQATLLDAFRKWEGEPIQELAQKFNPVKRTYGDFEPIHDNAIMDTIDKYLAQYLAIPTFVLVDMTHARETPWTQTMAAARDSVNIGMRISDDLISRFFEGREFAL